MKVPVSATTGKLNAPTWLEIDQDGAPARQTAHHPLQHLPSEDGHVSDGDDAIDYR